MPPPHRYGRARTVLVDDVLVRHRTKEHGRRYAVDFKNKEKLEALDGEGARHPSRRRDARGLRLSRGGAVVRRRPQLRCERVISVADDPAGPEQLRREHLADLSEGTVSPQVCVAYLAVLNAFVRVGDHVENVAGAISGEK